MEKVYGVIGEPIKHSLSPFIHNQAFTNDNISARYHAFLVKKQNLGKAVEGMKVLGFSGCNVTIPHKEEILPFLDEVDELARKIGAVNTVVRKEDSFIGYNTDGIGFVRGLREAIPEEKLEDRSILIIGAGGAAKAIYYTLLSDGFRVVDIANRSLNRAKELQSNCLLLASQSSKALTMKEAEALVGQYDILIQTTSVGMSPNVDESPLSLVEVKEGAHVFDIIYNPFQTKFLSLAEEKGCTIHNGIDMFIYQAAYAFQIWTGRWPNTENMKKLVIEQLGG